MVADPLSLKANEGEDRIVAPGELELVRQFLNTLRVESRRDLLVDRKALATWLTRHKLVRTTSVTPSEYRTALELRAKLRSLIESRDQVAASTIDELNRIVKRTSVGLEFTPSGEIVLRSRATGVKGALGALLAISIEAIRAGEWKRLKLCSREDCRWAFYDHSRNTAGRWCEMQVCGSRAKQRAYRRRKATSARPGSGQDAA